MLRMALGPGRRDNTKEAVWGAFRQSEGSNTSHQLWTLVVMGVVRSIMK